MPPSEHDFETDGCRHVEVTPAGDVPDVAICDACEAEVPASWRCASEPPCVWRSSGRIIEQPTLRRYTLLSRCADHPAPPEVPA